MRKFISITAVVVLLLSLASFKLFNLEGNNAISATANKPPTVGLNLGNQAPELSLKDQSGVVIKLSSLRGKMVLIDFWASWCGPCRRENPAVVNAYNLYSSKKFKNGDGFTIYSVSLDMEVEAWKKAISKDGLVWASHVSDLQGWYGSAVGLYNITGIPANFLINDQGIIINKNLRGAELNAALSKLVIQQ